MQNICVMAHLGTQMSWNGTGLQCSTALPLPIVLLTRSSTASLAPLEASLLCKTDLFLQGVLLTPRLLSCSQYQDDTQAFLQAHCSWLVPQLQQQAHVAVRSDGVVLPRTATAGNGEHFGSHCDGGLVFIYFFCFLSITPDFWRSYPSRYRLLTRS